MIGKEQALEAAEIAVQAAKEAGADDVAVQIESSQHQFARFARNRIILTMERNPVTVSIAASVGKKECSLTMSGIEEDTLRTVARRCVNNANLFVENEEHLPPVDVKEHRHVNAVDPAISAMEPGDLANTIGDVCSLAVKDKLEAFGTHGRFHGLRCVVNSSGTAVAHEWTKTGASLTLKTPDGQGSGRDETESYFLSDFNFQKLYDNAREAAVTSQSPQQIEPGDYTVILSPQAASAYITFVMFALDARVISEGRSVFSYLGKGTCDNNLDQEIFSPLLTVRSMVDDPRYPVAPFNPAPSFEGSAGQGNAASLFSNGLPTENSLYIDKGRIKDLFYSHYWAHYCGKKPLGFPPLLVFESSGQTSTTEEMIASTKRGLYISSFWYIRFVDMNSLLLTGLTRDGAFLIENGRITKPIKNLRFNESPFHSLQKLQSLGIPEFRRLWMQMVLIPAMKIDDFTFSSVSDAI